MNGPAFSAAPDELLMTRAKPWDGPGSAAPALYGLPGQRFTALHVTAVVCMGASLTASCYLVASVLWKCTAITSRPITVRLAFYLAICDIGFYGNHIVDHGYILFAETHYPFSLCFTGGFLLYVFGIGQNFFLLLTSEASFVKVVMERTIDWGNYDWKMLTIVFSSTTTLSIVGACFRVFGPGDMM